MKISQAIKSLWETGGFTISISGELNPNHGYSVAKSKNNEQKIKLSKVDKLGLYVAISSYAESHEKELREKNSFIGGWIEDGILYLDVSELIEDKKQAIQSGIDREQLAIFDNKKMSCISLQTAPRLQTI